MTAKEILEIAEKNLTIEDFAEGYYDPTEYGFGTVQTVDSYGGEEQGSTYYTVRYFVDHNVYIRTEGYYSSYHGTDWDFGYGKEVFPKQKTITVYE
jgi:hypothetical protein